jgi:hypothetical protein
VTAAASAFAAAELAATILFGRFFDHGRAEALLFFAFRPWLLLIAAMLAHRIDWRSRYAFYGVALLLASMSESLFLLGLGAGNPWPAAARGYAAGALAALVFDALLQLGSRTGGKLGWWAAAVLLPLPLALSGSLGLYDVIAAGKAAPATAQKRDLMLLSALPLIWGEQGPLDPGSSPAAAYTALAREFRVRPLDVLDEKSLATGRLLLLAQPRALAPGELVALDLWVRRGGRALVLSDPQLVWPSTLALGDIRRAPAIGLLEPLLNHWGLRLVAPPRVRAVTQRLAVQGPERRLALFAPGTLISTSDNCAVGPTPQIARCDLGKGEAIIVADADMLHDQLWVGSGSGGSQRHGRTADNPLIVADWLDALAGDPRPRLEAPVQWLSEGTSRTTAWLLALLPILAATLLAASLGLRRRS